MEEKRYEDLPVNVAQPVVGAQPTPENEWDKVAKKTTALKIIDLMRPDYHKARGMAAQIARKEGRTTWKPTARYNKQAHQGVRECARRLRAGRHKT